MTREQWRLVWRICETARSLPQTERTAFIQANAPDVEIESQVVALLNEPNLSVAASWDPLYKAGPDRSMGEGRAITLTPELTRTGLNIGRYVVEEVLGRGAVGEVYSARDVELDRRVALKFLGPASLNAGLLVGGSLREARAASALNHPGIITVHEVIQSESGLAIVMEYVDGTPLREVCGTPMQPPTVARLGIQIAKALAAAHSHGIIHRDIKPENIMVRADGYLKVVDFGLAKDVRGSEKSLSAGLLVGTFRYMSPEQTRGEVLTPATDVFSLGLVLYELSTGRHPFATAGVLETVRAIASVDPAPPSAVRPEIPKALDSLIRKMLAKSKEARPSAAEVAERFEELLQTAPAPTNRRWVTIGIVAVTLAMLALVWNFRRTEDANPIVPVPLTAQTGWESAPQISPDGQSVVYAWGSSPDRPTHIYIAGIDQQAPVAIVKAATGEFVGVPVWSPDGRRVIYKQQASLAGPGAIWSVSADGGNHHKLKDLYRADLSSGLSLSPDGNTLLYTDSKPEDQYSIRSLNLTTMTGRILTTPPANHWGDWDPRFSPDGGTIAFKRVKDFWQDYIYTMSAAGGPARQITYEKQGIWSHAWMPGGSLLLSCQLGGVVFGLWRIPVNQSGKPQPLFVTDVDAVTPAVSLDGSRIAWANRINDHNIYSIPIRGGKPSKIVATTAYESSPAVASDGRLAYVSYRSGSAEIWLGAAEGPNAVRVTSLKKGVIGHPVWSPDGKRLLFDSSAYGNSAILSMECPPKTTECGSPSRTNPNTDAEVWPGWSADGKFIYFTAVNGNRTHQIWKRPAEGGPAVQITRSGAFGSQESRDGKWVYYAKFTPTFETPTIWRTPVTDGNELKVKEELVIGPPYHPTTDWTLAGNEVVFFDRGDESHAPAFRAYHTVTAQVRTIVDVDKGNYPAISADGRTLLYSALDRSGANIMVAKLSR